MTKSQLTPEQKLVVTHPFGQHARVLAVAGSGKSTTMAYRIKYLIQEGGIQSDRIMALMFNSLARKQFNAHLEKAGVTIKPPVHTFHSFSFQVIHRALQCELLPVSTQFWLSDKEELIWLMVKRAINNLERSKKIPSEMIDPELALNTIQLWKGALIPPHRAGSTTSEYLPLVYGEFERLRQMEQILTFDDFIPVTVSLLETNSPIAQHYTQNLQHLIIDEYQDINFGQQRLIELLAGKQADVMVVGDDDQTVYEWRGARPNYILNDFTKVFDNKPIQDYKLSRSFRFGPLIAQCAANLISNNLNRLEKPLSASQPSQYGFIHVISGGQNEAKELTEQITALVNGDHVPKKEIIVLARLYAQLDHLESEFLNRKIWWREEAGKNPRAVIEGTVREVKHPFHCDKLPVRGLFHVTILMVSSAAMTNVRRIHHYLERKRRAAEQMEGQNQKENEKSVKSSSSFWLFVNWLQKWFSSLVVFRKLCFNC